MRDQRGVSLSPFIVVVVPVLLVVIGLVVDGGAQAAAKGRAERVAAAAARAACDDTAAYRLAGREVDVGRAKAVAQQVIAGEAGLTGVVTVRADTVVVHTHAVTSTVLLSLIGIDELAAEGAAEASLVADR